MKSTWVIVGIALVFDVIWALVKEPHLLRFVDMLSLSSYICLLIGVARWGWIKGDFAYFNWNPYRNESFKDHRTQVEEDRKEKRNPMLYAGCILFIASLILTFWYMKFYR